jgi:hypothetical protein
MATREPIFILKHYDTDVDNFKIYSNVDDALNTLRKWLKIDDFLMNYVLSKYELEPDGVEYEHTKDYDLDELIDISDGTSDDISVIDSGEED